MHLHSESDIPAKLTEASRRRHERKSLRHNEQFLRGPIALRWVCAAARLPGKPLAVAMAVMFKVGVERCDTVAVSRKLLERFGVGRQAGYRGLKALEQAKLVEVERHRGRCPRVTVKGAHLSSRSTREAKR
jgi:hypothetical protein